jgi:hypothetical protein
MNAGLASFAYVAPNSCVCFEAQTGKVFLWHEPELCAEVAAFRERIAGADRGTPTTNPRVRASVLLQSLLSVNLRAPSTLNNRERLLRK